MENFLQFIKFGLVGISNTAISYGVEMLCYYVLVLGDTWPQNVRVLVITTLSFLIGVTNSYYWNSRYVFIPNESKKPVRHIRAYAKTVLCYAITGLLISPAIKLWLTNRGILYWKSSLVALIVSIPLDFFLNKKWAFVTERAKKK